MLAKTPRTHNFLPGVRLNEVCQRGAWYRYQYRLPKRIAVINDGGIKIRITGIRRAVVIKPGVFASPTALGDGISIAVFT